MRAVIIMLLSIGFTTSGHTTDRAEWNPPTRFDHPFSGELVLKKLPQHSVAKACQDLFSAHGQTLKTTFTQRGCAFVNEDASKCWIVMIDRRYRTTEPAAVLRHEIGHCNGWSGDHPD